MDFGVIGKKYLAAVAAAIIASLLWNLVAAGQGGKKDTIACNDCSLVFISIDTLRADHVGAYGHHRDTTPNIDELSKKSVLFKHAYSPIPSTLPSHSSMFTGNYPRTNGVVQNWYRVSKHDQMLAERLGESGFNTASFVNFYPLSEYGFEQGFDKAGFYEQSSRMTGEAITWIKENQGKRFFTFIHYMDLHNPYNPPLEYVRQIGKVRKDLNASDDNLKKNKRDPELLEYAKLLYDADLRKVDEDVGRIITALSEQGLMEKTIILITSDHGEGFMDHGELFHGDEVYDEQIHVPLAIYSPKLQPVKTWTQVNIIDYTPTLLTLLGLKAEQGFEGRDITDAIGPGNNPNPLVAESTNNPFRLVKRYAVIDYPLKMIVTQDPSGKRIEIYSLAEDPGEKNNLQADKPRLHRRLQKILDGWLQDPRHQDVKRQTPDTQIEETLRNLGYL